jgi:hypothetical protein
MSEEEKENKVEIDDGTVDIEVGEGHEEESVEIDDLSDSAEENAVTAKEDEHEEYSQSVKKRIDRLTKKMREAERQREEALKYAQNVQSETETLRQRVQALDQGYMTEYGSRLSMEQQQVESELKRAVEMGDSDATVAAQRKLTQLAVASDRYETTKQAQERALKERQERAQQPNPQQFEQQPQPQPAVRAPDPKAEDWASKNEWFGSDEAMTFAAFGVHKRLVEDEGFDPTSDEYYSELDNRIRKEFPHKFKDSTGKRPVQNVAGSARGSTGRTGRKQVKLTPSQVAIAKKLNVPLEEYAKYVK